jgi:ribosomal-protein-alanine acetyltransferase
MSHTTPTPGPATPCCTPAFRPAVEIDLPSIAALEAEIYTVEGPWPLDAFEEDFAEDGRRYLVVTCNDRVVGYAAASFDADNGDAEILMVTVDNDHRRRGVAKRFVDDLLEWCRSVGAETVNLQVRTDNDGPIALYRSLGFTHTAVLEDYYHPGCDAYEMSLTLETTPVTAP